MFQALRINVVALEITFYECSWSVRLRTVCNKRLNDAPALLDLTGELVQQVRCAWLHAWMHLCESHDSTHDRHKKNKFSAADVSITSLLRSMRQ